MTIDFDKLEFDTDKEKVNPRLTHTVYPLENNKDVSVECEYFKTGEIASYMDMSSNGRGNYRFRDIFKDKVTKINGIDVTVKGGKKIEVTDAKTFLSLPSNSTLDAILLFVTLHLIASDDLTEAEEKN